MEPWTTLIPPETPLQLSIPKASLETGYTSDVMITVADDLDQIFVQPIKDENMIAMTSLQEALNKHLDSSSPLKAIPSIGTYVASFFPEDNGFYRARVESVSGDSIKVHYIDFGNSCDVTLAELRNLPQELFKFPIVTYQVLFSFSQLKCSFLKSHYSPFAGVSSLCPQARVERTANVCKDLTFQSR